VRALPLGAVPQRQRLPRTLRLHFRIADARLYLQQLQLRVAELSLAGPYFRMRCHLSRSSNT
jgi:hypothetical protein